MNQIQERILDAAYPLVIRHGVRELSTGEFRASAAVSLAEFEAAFPSIDVVAEACLARREREWTVATVEAGARQRGTTPEGRLLAVFEVFDEWFRRDDFEACTFINVLLELGRAHPVGHASAVYLERIRGIVTVLAKEARLERPEEFARSMHILMKGSIISAAEGDQDAALRARDMAELLIAGFRTAPEDLYSFATDDLSWLEFDIDPQPSVVPAVSGESLPDSDGLGMLDWLDLEELGVAN